MYFSDLDDKSGGETIFTRGWPANEPEEDHIQLDKAIQDLRSSGQALALEEGSWEEELAAMCRSRLRVQSKAGRAILFYSLSPNGRLDPSSEHAGCPVLSGTKFAANLWVHTGPYVGVGAPKNPIYDANATARMMNKTLPEDYQPETDVPVKENTCYGKLLKAIDDQGIIPLLKNVSLVMHLNGDPEPCGKSDDDILDSIRNVLELAGLGDIDCPIDIGDKWIFEMMLTLLGQAQFYTSCTSKESHQRPGLGMFGYCDAGPGHTPILQDHRFLQPVAYEDGQYLPCHMHAQTGKRISTIRSLADFAAQATCGEDDCTDKRSELHLYAVPAGRHFMFAPSHVGQRIDLPHVRGADDNPVYLEVLSVEPRL
jgi:hypothetical protein